MPEISLEPGEVDFLLFTLGATWALTYEETDPGMKKWLEQNQRSILLKLKVLKEKNKPRLC